MSVSNASRHHHREVVVLSALHSGKLAYSFFEDFARTHFASSRQASFAPQPAFEEEKQFYPTLQKHWATNQRANEYRSSSASAATSFPSPSSESSPLPCEHPVEDEDDLTLTCTRLARRASLVVSSSSPRVCRRLCNGCGLWYVSDYDSLSESDTSSVKSFALSLKVEGSNKPSASQIFAMAEMASRLQGTRLIKDLARIQLKLALAVYMDRLAEFEIQEALVHKAIHEASDGSSTTLWHRSTHQIEGIAISQAASVPFKVGQNLPLLKPLAKELGTVRNFAELKMLEDRADQLFVPAVDERKPNFEH
ncbi:hypothetical protein BKA70DRAFT_1440145 [Coprinopsis sp. MPI-PUGE-AT-0042]|nr:hypothetical protein BKA70DRAFT_1440145 [Coprinopsis sp. MPI-PUGE-AT-0042]